MPSPFPGMDPFLEDECLWPGFQQQLIHVLYQMILPGLMDRYRARLSERRYSREQALFTSIIRENHHEPLLEIRQRSDGKLITVLEVLSPANKTTQEGRHEYLERRHDVRRQNANIVEIDLVLQGTALLDSLRENLPQGEYSVVVTRNTQPDRYQVYSAGLSKTLPRFRVPLASDDRDTVIDLQLATARAFEQGSFFDKIDYHQDPKTQISAEQRIWIEQRLVDAKLRP